MTSCHTKRLHSIILGTALALSASTALAGSANTLQQAVNTFQNATATGGAQMTVDAKGPIAITDAVELPGFAFNVYDVDVTPNSVTLTLVAQLEKLKVTQYDDTTFDRYYIALDKPVANATISEASNAHFAATVEIIKPGTTVSTAGAFVKGMASEFTFEHGGMLITVGDGTNLNKIKADGGSLTVTF